MVATSADRATTWAEANQRCLVAELARIRGLLERHAASAATPDDCSPADAAMPNTADGAVVGEVEQPAIELLSRAFGLSGFEREVLLLCAGVELDAGFAAACAAAQGDPTRLLPTFSLALAILDAPHWSALAPNARLRHWRLIEVVDRPELPLTASPLRIDERILHFLAGVDHLDDRLLGLVEPVTFDGTLVPSHREVARRIALGWTRAAGALPLVQLFGADEASRRAVVAGVCGELGLRPFALCGNLIPTSGGEIDALLRLWEREAILTSSALYVDVDDVATGEPRGQAMLFHLLERLSGPALAGARERMRPLRRRSLTFDVHKPTSSEQREVWKVALRDTAGRLDGPIGRLVAEFNLSVPAIQAAVQQALTVEADANPTDALWQASRAQARPRLEDLAQRIESTATWDDLVLPAPESELLRAIAGQVRHRATVYDAWGLGKRGGRGLGISALFAGPSGTGKTLAAEVLAGDLDLDLYRVDLSSVVSKYIGETEKNLRRVFDAAEDGGTILFFDEADALFGKRSEVKDSHDRYANVEISYLLQRMEAFRGLAVLATNLKGSLDPAFLRRIRFVVNFPFPDAQRRAEIWRRAFPPTTPTEGLDLAKLARLSVAGGNIRNIALNAAFSAAAEGEPVRMAHVLHATRQEYAKLEKPLSPAEIGGWV